MVTNSNSEINESLMKSSEIASSENKLIEQTNSYFSNSIESQIQEHESTIFHTDKSYIKEYNTKIISDISETEINNTSILSTESEFENTFESSSNKIQMES